MSVRRSAQLITAALPLLLVGAAAPATALDPASPAPAPAAQAAQQEPFTLPLEISGVVDGLSDEETARVEAHALGVSGDRSPIGEARADADGRYLLEGSAQPGAPVLVEVTVWEPGHEDEASTTWYGDSPELSGAEPLRATGSMDGVDVTVARQQVPEAAGGSEGARAVPAAASAPQPGAVSAAGLSAAESGVRPSADHDAQRLILALLASASFVGALALLRRALGARRI